MDAATRHLVADRAGRRCEYCRLPQAASPFLTFHIEHIQARQHIADDDLANLALACPHCNLHKGPNLTSLDLETRAVVELFNPRIQVWDDHFRLDGADLVGTSQIGRVTVRLLRMNDLEQLEIRAGLLLRGEF